MRSHHRLQMGRPHAAVVQRKSNDERSALVLVRGERVLVGDRDARSREMQERDEPQPSVLRFLRSR